MMPGTDDGAQRVEGDGIRGHQPLCKVMMLQWYLIAILYVVCNCLQYVAEHSESPTQELSVSYTYPEQSNTKAWVRIQTKTRNTVICE
jgi:hypothetical protein